MTEAQTTISTGYTATGTIAGVTFNVQNTNATTVRLKSLGCIVLNPASVYPISMQVWYKTSGISGVPGAISTANGWILAGNDVFYGNDPVNVTEYFSHLNIQIPSGQTYGIYVSSSSSMRFKTVAAGTRDTFTAGGVRLITGNTISYGGTVAGPTTTMTGFMDYIKFETAPACSARPNAGSIYGISGFCNASTANNRMFSLKNFTSATGLTFQWQSATTATGTYSNLGTNASILANSVAGARFYRCILTCSSGLSDTTKVLADTLLPSTVCTNYCGSTYTNTQYFKIDSVVFLGVRNGSSATVCEVYTDYRRVIAPPRVKVRNSFDIDIVSGDCGNIGAYPLYGAIYIDYNRNNSFEATELVSNSLTTTAAPPVRLSRTATIPSSAKTGITGMRVLWNYASTINTACFTGSYGETEDYAIEIYKDSIDMAIVHADSNLNGCNLTTIPIKFTVLNAGGEVVTSPSYSYSIDGGSPVTEIFPDVAPDSTRHWTFTTTANVSLTGSHIIKIWHNRAGDSTKSNDTIYKTIINFPSPTSIIADDDTVCNGSLQGIIKAVSNPPFMTRWYSDATGFNNLGTGNQYVMLNPTADTTFYAKSVITHNTGLGLTSYAPEGFANTAGSGIIFDVYRNKVQINSVRFKVAAAGTGLVEIRNAGGTTLASITYLAPTPGELVLPINVTLPIGTGYRMVMATQPGSVSATLGFTNYFPLQVPNVIALTGSIFTGGYNTFYDWQVTYDACETGLIPVKIKYVGTTASPARVLPKRDTACEFPPNLLNAGNSGCTYNWQDNTTGQSIVTPASGLFIVTITNSLGCNVVDSSQVVIYSSPVFSLGQDTSICFGKAAYLKTGFSNAGYNHTWSTGSLDPFIQPKALGQYSVYVFNTTTNCGYRDTVNLMVIPVPNVFLGRDTSACNATPIVFNAPYNPSYSYKWDNGSTASSRSISSTNKIWVEVRDNSTAYACKSSDTVLVTIATLTKPDLGADKVSCNDEELIGLASSGNLEYRWSSGETSNLIKSSKPGNYSVTVSEVGTTCSYSDTINLQFIPSPPLEIGEDIVTCGTSVTLKANKGWNSYAWSNGFNTDSMKVGTTNTYSVTVTNPCGSKTDNILVTFVQPITSFNLPNDTLICNPMTLTIPTQPASNEIKWSTGDVGNSSIVADKTGNYWVSVNNACGTFSDAIDIILDTMPTADFDYSHTGEFIAFQNRSLNAKKYTWDFGDTKSSNLRNASHIYDSINTYTITLTVENSCGQTATKSVTIDLSKSGIQTLSAGSIDIYPNPTSGMVSIKNLTSSLFNSDIQIFTMDGKLIKAMNKVNLLFDTEMTLDMSDLANGSYFIKISNEKSTIVNKLYVNK